MDPIDIIIRLDCRRRVLPADAACSTCGIDLPILLRRWRGRVICYQCHLVAVGRSGWELHHVGGASSPVHLLVPVNLHRLLSYWQELAWRGTFPPASRQAVAWDVAGILLIGSSFFGGAA